MALSTQSQSTQSLYGGILQQIASGLSFLEARGVVHGNLCTSNVVFTDRQHRSVVIMGPTNTSCSCNDASGVWRWSAPELLQEQNVMPTSASDSWGFACLLSELSRRGRKPFDHFESSQQLLRAIDNPGFSAAGLLTSTGDAWAHGIIAQCTALNPAKRISLARLHTRVASSAQDAADATVAYQKLLARSISSAAQCSSLVFNTVTMANAMTVRTVIGSKHEALDLITMLARLKHPSLPQALASDLSGPIVGVVQSWYSISFEQYLASVGPEPRVLMALKRYLLQAAQALQALSVYQVSPVLSLSSFGLYQPDVPNSELQLRLTMFTMEPFDATRGQTAQQHSIQSFFEDFVPAVCRSMPALRQSESIAQAYQAYEDRTVQTCSQLIKLLGSQHRHPETGLPHEISWSKLSFVRQLGSGQFGECNLMSLEGSQGRQVLVAVKTLLEGGDEAEFVKELDLLERLNHNNLVQLYHVITQESPKALVLEYLAGGDLQHWLESSTGTDNDRIFILSQVARGLQALHSQNIVHRDLAARNVLLDESLRCVITDFGLSRVMASSAVDNSEYYTLSSEGPQALPLRWMAPETLKTRKFTKESDVYSFGCLMIEMYSGGQYPFQALESEQLIRLMLKMVQTQPEMTLMPVPTLPSKLQPVLHDALRPRPNQRPTAAALAEKLHIMWAQALQRLANQDSSETRV
eukprot:TRINITY_DN10937_c0_g1_i4.p1 TRINITY_DN10937_c0_g1~~TRINITY_DN10937_c0_g1_i4.p1  ORF type:complete len:789 (+),score=149.36 TRINITY_DN10937_c0_g1_i4:283-2367(+)